jgi:uncharacterized damage-inducible protein DinB
MDGRLLRDAFGHHVWATHPVIDASAQLTRAQLASTVPGTYGSIIDTLRHLVGADSSYLWLLSGGEVTAMDDEAEAAADLTTLRAAMDEDGRVWARVLERDLDPDALVTRHRDDGSSSSAPLGVRLAQVIHHGTDHRSQVCTALTTLGVTPPDIDVWDYAASDGRLSETPPAPEAPSAP